MTKEMIVNGMRFNLIKKGTTYDIEYVTNYYRRIIGWADTLANAETVIKRWLSL